MITCEKCGHENPPATSFCGNCGHFLKFSSASPRQSAPAAEPEPPEVVEAAADTRPPAPPSITQDSGQRAEATPSPTPHAAGQPVGAPPPPPPLPPDDATPTPEAAGAGVPEPASPPPVTPPPPAAHAAPAPTQPIPATPPPDASALVDRAPVASEPVSPPTTVYRTDATATAGQSGEQLPTHAEIQKRRRVKKRQDRDEEKVRQAEYRRKGLRPGDLVCPTCGAGNDPERQFCRIDATPLHEAEVVEETRWWHRLNPFARFSRERRNEERRREGQSVRHGDVRKRGRMAFRRAQSTAGKVRRLTAILALVGIGVVSLTPSLRNDARDRGESVVDTVRDWFGSPPTDPISAIGAAVTSSIEVEFAPCVPDGAAADALSDGKAFTYWSEGAEGDGIGSVIEFTFQSRIDLNSIGIFGGPGTCPDADRLANPRPRTLELRYIRVEGGVSEVIGSDVIELLDSEDFQTFDVEGKDFDRLVVEIQSVYESDIGSATAIAEVEFFGALDPG